MEYIKGLDTSHWSDNYKTPITIDWNIAEQKGIRFVITKASEATNYTDPTVDIIRQGVRKTSLDLGFYHFLSSYHDSILQAVNFYDIIKPDRGEVPECLDVEDFYPQTRPLSRGQKLYNQTYVFLEEIASRTGRLPMIYTSPKIILYYYGIKWAEKLTKYWLWLAQYFDYTYYKVDEIDFAPWPKATIWQYSDREVSKQFGFTESNAVDANIFLGTESEYNSFCGRSAPKPKILTSEEKLQQLFTWFEENHGWKTSD